MKIVTLIVMNGFGSVFLLVGCLCLANVPASGQEVLFSIERSLNKDQIVYFLHLDEKGCPKREDPISLLWLDNEHTGELVPVNWLKKKFGYGIQILSQTSDEVRFKFVSYEQKLFTLKKDVLGNYGVFATINNRMMKISHVFLKIEGGTFWKPNITEVTVTGFTESANTRILETFKPYFHAD
nr:DUF4833 domain-containing protein [Cytophagales bacterium]